MGCIILHGMQLSDPISTKVTRIPSFTAEAGRADASAGSRALSCDTSCVGVLHHCIETLPNRASGKSPVEQAQSPLKAFPPMARTKAQNGYDDSECFSYHDLPFLLPVMGACAVTGKAARYFSRSIRIHRRVLKRTSTAFSADKGGKACDRVFGRGLSPFHIPSR